MRTFLVEVFAKYGAENSPKGMITTYCPKHAGFNNLNVVPQKTRHIARFLCATSANF